MCRPCAVQNEAQPVLYPNSGTSWGQNLKIAWFPPIVTEKADWVNLYTTILEGVMELQEQWHI